MTWDQLTDIHQCICTNFNISHRKKQDKNRKQTYIFLFYLLSDKHGKYSHWPQNVILFSRAWSSTCASVSQQLRREHSQWLQFKTFQSNTAVSLPICLKRWNLSAKQLIICGNQKDMWLQPIFLEDNMSYLINVCTQSENLSKSIYEIKVQLNIKISSS